MNSIKQKLDTTLHKVFKTHSWCSFNTLNSYNSLYLIAVWPWCNQIRCILCCIEQCLILSTPNFWHVGGKTRQLNPGTQAALRQLNFCCPTKLEIFKVSKISLIRMTACGCGWWHIHCDLGFLKFFIFVKSVYFST